VERSPLSHTDEVGRIVMLNVEIKVSQNGGSGIIILFSVSVLCVCTKWGEMEMAST
jgi:hypothetical protein